MKVINVVKLASFASVNLLIEQVSLVNIGLKNLVLFIIQRKANRVIIAHKIELQDVEKA